MIRRFCRILLAEERPSRAFYLDLLQREDEPGLCRVRRLDREIAAGMGRLIEECAADLDVPESRAAATDSFLRVISGILDHLFFDPGGDERELILRLTQMYASLLGLERPADSGQLLEMCATAGRLIRGAQKRCSGRRWRRHRPNRGPAS